jgi:hypothetical protein
MRPNERCSSIVLVPRPNEGSEKFAYILQRLVMGHNSEDKKVSI